jgi:hypothetical protein
MASPPRSDRWKPIVALVLVGVVAFAGGMILANAREGRESALPSPSPSPTVRAPHSSTPSQTPEPTRSPGGPMPVLEDGRYFVFIEDMPVTPPGPRMTFDLAEFLTGEAANQAALEHGDGSPPPNDYYIVNDNPGLRTIAFAPDVELRILDGNDCCSAFIEGDLTAMADAVANGDPSGTYRPDSPFWITLDGGLITEIEEQYLP